ncbi:MAG: antitoxin [Chlorobiaceae bacterium]|nr:antitoxin [Chlorobiaceae bacterium]
MFDRISVNPKICHGKPCIKGTRIMISVILGLVEEGLNFTQIIEEYPELSEADIKAAIEYARLMIENEEIHALEQINPA